MSSPLTRSAHSSVCPLTSTLSLTAVVQNGHEICSEAHALVMTAACDRFTFPVYTRAHRYVKYLFIQVVVSE